MDDKTFKHYKNAKANLRTLPILMFIGVGLFLAQFSQFKGALEWHHYVDLVMCTIVISGAIGLLAYKHWARILLAAEVTIGLGFTVILLALFIQAGAPPSVNGALGLRIIFGAYFLTILLGKKSVEVMNYHGDIDRLRHERSGFATPVEAVAPTGGGPSSEAEAN